MGSLLQQHFDKGIDRNLSTGPDRPGDGAASRRVFDFQDLPAVAAFWVHEEVIPGLNPIIEAGREHELVAILGDHHRAQRLAGQDAVERGLYLLEQGRDIDLGEVVKPTPRQAVDRGRAGDDLLFLDVGDHHTIEIIT